MRLQLAMISGMWSLQAANRRAEFARLYAAGYFGWQCAELAGYKASKRSLYAQGSKLLADPRVQTLIAEERRRRLEASEQELARALKALGAAAEADARRGAWARAARAAEQLASLDRRIATLEQELSDERAS